jgi:hypothetical protein
MNRYSAIQGFVAGFLIACTIAALVLVYETRRALLDATVAVHETRIVAREVQAEARETRALAAQALKNIATCEEANDEHEKKVEKK